MGQVICFERRKYEILRDAVEKAESHIDKTVAEAEWLKRWGAPLADLVKASMNVEKAVEDHRAREEAVARLYDYAASGAPVVACE